MNMDDDKDNLKGSASSVFKKSMRMYKGDTSYEKNDLISVCFPT